MIVPTCPSSDLVDSEANEFIPLICPVPCQTIMITRTMVSHQTLTMSSTPRTLHNQHGRKERKNR